MDSFNVAPRCAPVYRNLWLTWENRIRLISLIQFFGFGICSQVPTFERFHVSRVAQVAYVSPTCVGCEPCMRARLGRDVTLGYFTCCRDWTTVTPSLLGFPLKQRVDYKIVHKVVVGHAPFYLTGMLTAVTDVRSRSTLNSRCVCILYVNGDYCRLQEIRCERAFSVAAH